MSRDHPYVLAKLKILNILFEKDGATYKIEIKRKLKADPSVGKGKGSYTNTKNQLDQLQKLGVIKNIGIEYNGDNRGKRYKLNEDRNEYEYIKELYDKYEKGSHSFLSNKFLENEINKDFLHQMIKNEYPILRELLYVLNTKKYYDESKTEEIYKNIPKGALKKLIFPPDEIDEIIDIVSSSGSAFDLIMYPEEKYKEKFIKLMRANAKYFVNYLDIDRFLSTPSKEKIEDSVMDLINNLNKEKEENITKKVKNLFNHKYEKRSPMLKLFHSFLHVDYFKDNVVTERIINSDNYLSLTQELIDYKAGV
ncbi:MAG: hypothetical protein ACOC7O_00880 [Thermoplasmatota archaeon]